MKHLLLITTLIFSLFACNKEEEVAPASRMMTEDSNKAKIIIKNPGNYTYALVITYLNDNGTHDEMIMGTKPTGDYEIEVEIEKNQTFGYFVQPQTGTGPITGRMIYKGYDNTLQFEGDGGAIYGDKYEINN